MQFCRRAIPLCSLALLGVWLTMATGQEPDPQAVNPPQPETTAATDVSPAGSAMVTLFSPARAPQRKTMGLLQRSFLDLADQDDQALQVAIVVDGTDSMTSELAGVRASINQMIADLKRFRNNEVKAAVVVYRDAGSPSGEVVIPIKSFTDDPDTLAQAVEELRPESGAPFFHELPDLGIHQALTKLPWSKDDQVAKWILMFGDAPPYEASFQDKKNKAYRRYATPLLVSLSRQKNVRINCVLCTSSENVSTPYQSAIDQTRSFMNELCRGTDGLMLDMSYPEIRTAMIDAGKQPETPLAPIEPITSIDLVAANRGNQSGGDFSGNAQTVRIAVLPHLPLDQMTFDASNPAVRVSTAVRTQLSKVPGVVVASPREVKDQLRRLRAQGLTDNQAIRGLSARLGVEFVVWGELQTQSASVRTAAYRRDTGRPMVPVTLGTDVTQTAAVALIKAAAESAADDQALAMLVKRMEDVSTTLSLPMSDDAATEQDLLSAIESLDQALGYEAASDESVPLLEAAGRSAADVINVEPRNGIAHWIASNVAYNQAARLFQAGKLDAAKARTDQMRSALRRAMENREGINDPSLRTEIEADYYLLVARDVDQAVKRYESLTSSDLPLVSQLRGHWMLAGIRAGDWGTANLPSVDPDAARGHVVQILANWPESPEAELLKQWLRWDETSESTQFNYLPQVHTSLTGV